MLYFNNIKVQLVLILLFCIFSALSLKSQNILNIEIENLKNNTGKILLELSDAEKKFVKGIATKITDKSCIITLDSLKEGNYSFKYFHDENNNEKIDTNWLGIPKEGFGFSNNAKGTFGPPPFEKTIFYLKGAVTQKCTPRYY